MYATFEHIVMIADLCLNILLDIGLGLFFIVVLKDAIKYILNK